MTPWLMVLIAVASGIAVAWVLLVAALYWEGRNHSDPTSIRAALRLIPDVVRLLRRLAADPTVPRGVRIRLTVIVVYLALPVDLIPDFIPVVGYADDAMIVAFALRSVARAAGPEALDRHWPGEPQGLQAIKRLAGIKG